jgi:hypothetical protein
MFVSGEMLFLSDFRNKNIQILSMIDGAYIQTFDGNGKFKRPTQLCIFGDYLFVADIIGNNNSIIHVLNATDGSYVRSIGDGQLGYPSDMLVSGQEIFLLESNNRIQVLNVNDGSYIRTMANERGSQPGQFNFPSDICVLGQEIFVSDLMNNRIQVLNVNDGSYIRTIGNGGGSQPGQFNMPSSICVSKKGELFVMDLRNRRVQVFQI